MSILQMPGTSQFPSTHLSAIRGLSDTDANLRKRSWNSVVAVYWKPAYTYARLRWRLDAEAAQDTVQAFFLAAFGKQFLADFDPGKARFRTFFRTCLDRFIMNGQQAAGRQKRGGEVEHISLDFAFAESELARMGPMRVDAIDRLFDQAWARSVLTAAVERLRTECTVEGKLTHYQVFEAYDLAVSEATDVPSYAKLAAQFSISESAVTNYLAWARRRFRQAVLRTISDLTASEEEYRAEVRAVLGITLP